MVATVSLGLATGAASKELWYLLTSQPPGRCRSNELLRLLRNPGGIENSLHHVKDRSWEEHRHTLRRPGLGEVSAALVNVCLNALRLEKSFPAAMSMPLRARANAFRPEQATARLSGESL